MARPPGLSKSRFTSGLQCHRQLWWRVHERDAPELTPDPAQQAIFDQGSRVGEVARGYVAGGTLIDLPYDDFAGKLAATKLALASETSAIYEASFHAGGVFVAVDILAREGDGWRVIEVKSSTSVKDPHIPDAAIQVHVLREAGLTITGVDIMVLDRRCTYPDLADLFLRVDVTGRVEKWLADVPGLVREQLAVIAGPIPEVAIGPHCGTPYECPFLDRCWPPQPEHHVRTLFRVGANLAKFEANGWTMIHDLPAGLKLNAQAERQRRAVQAGRMIVDGDLARSLARFKGPLAFLDFETVMPAIPVWDGCHPYDQVPVQFSCHREAEGGSLEHFEWLAEGPGDPRAEIARRIVAACRGARTVVAYNMTFEKSCLERLAEVVPDLAGELRDVIARLEDPLPVLREHVYHPGFGGSFSLKAVLPALVPELNYDGLEIAHGMDAALMLARLVLAGDAMAAGERASAREALLRYCERDTLAMVKVLERLRGIGGTA